MTSSERVHCFGPRESLVGIVTLPPEGSPADSERPFVLVLSSGLVHRVGPFRLGVLLARTLATRGFRVLRFDLSGVGDSPTATTGAPREDQAVSDGRAAMDFLKAQYGATRFIVIGLCSGAVYAHRIVVADERVAGICMLDGYAYPTRCYRWHMLGRRLRNPGSVYRSVLRRVGRLFSWGRTAIGGPGALDAGGAYGKGDGVFYQEWPDIKAARSEIEQILRRGSRMLFVYSGGWSTFVDLRQFDEMFPSVAGHPGLTVSYHPEADHTYVSLADREVLLKVVADFATTVR